MRVVDIGANFGYFTLLLCRLVGAEGKVYAFEPQTHLHSFLEYNIQCNGYGGIARAYRVALGADSGMRQLARVESGLGTYGGSGSLDEMTAGELVPSAGEAVLVQETVRVARLDDLSLGRIDFAKIDAEGSEHDIWRGGRATLSQAQCLVMEDVPRWLAGGTVLLEDLVASGFRLSTIEVGGWLAAGPPREIHAVAEARGFTYVFAAKPAFMKRLALRFGSRTGRHAMGQENHR
ncbi:MAG: FkbM family methyltransferase [Armatimonadota bacterium]|nr:FkbM family methyltransferase [Armatimonadota bacterium]